MRSVYVSLLSYKATPHVETQQSLVQCTLDCARNGVDMKLRVAVGDSILPRARNRIVADFLASTCDDLLMIDDDLAWEEGAIRRITGHPVDIVGGLYPTRADPVRWPVKRLPGGHFDPATGLLAVRMVPSGFLRMSRYALQSMVDRYPELAYRDRYAPGGKAWALFWFDMMTNADLDREPGPDDLPEIVGEDYRFCMRWRDMGGDVYADTPLRFRHFGMKGWEGCYAETLPIVSLMKEAS